MKPRKLLQRLTQSQTNVRLSALTHLIEALGFLHDRTAGSHRIYIHRLHREAQLNIQPDGSRAKPYQIKQLLKLVEEYDLRLDEESR